MSEYLMHYGVKGQKWGIRRYQNKDGSLTEEGRKHYMYPSRRIRAGKTKSDVERIINTMSKDEKDRLALDDNDLYLTYEQGSTVAKRILKKHGDTPVAFFDMLEDGNNINVSLGTRSGSDYRGKGYASKAAAEGMKWYEKNKRRLGYEKVIWGVRTDNEASIKIAKKMGFKLDPTSYSDDKKWVNYEKS